MTCAGVIHNPKSRHNRGAEPPPAGDSVMVEAPRGRRALDETLARFAAAKVELLVIDGGDGTVREVLTRAPLHFQGALPRLAVLPSGKTNALAFDLGAPKDWGLQGALASARLGRIARRRPIEVIRAGADAPLVRGFIFGAGVFVRATDLAQRTHKLGAFEGLAVALTFGAAAFETFFGPSRSGWRRGEPMQLQFDAEPARGGDVFLILASTLERLPLGLEPLGPRKAESLRTLVVDAPPRRLVQALPPLLSGKTRPWLEAAGYHQRTPATLGVHLETSFVLDGETFEGGDFTLRLGEALEFVTP